MTSSNSLPRGNSFCRFRCRLLDSIAKALAGAVLGGPPYPTILVDKTASISLTVNEISLGFPTPSGHKFRLCVDATNNHFV